MSIPQPEEPSSRSEESSSSESGQSETEGRSRRPVPGQTERPLSRPAGVVIIAVVLVLEALALLAAAAWYAYGLLTSTPVSFGGAVFTLALLLVLAVWMLAVGHFLFRGYRWTRAAALVWQLLMLTLAVPTLTGGYVLYGLLLLVPPLAVLVLLFTKPVLSYVSRAANPPAAL